MPDPARKSDPKPDPKQSGTPLWLYIACVGIGAVAIAVVMALVMRSGGRP